MKKIKFGSNVKAYRNSLNLSQEDLAELLEINMSNISNIECGNQFVSLKTLCKLSQVLRVSISDLFKDDAVVSVSNNYREKLLTLSDAEAEYAYKSVKLFRKFRRK